VRQINSGAPKGVAVGHNSPLPMFPKSGQQRDKSFTGTMKRQASVRAWINGGRAEKANADHAAIVAARPLKPPGRK
jgi:hypothetical protein